MADEQVAEVAEAVAPSEDVASWQKVILTLNQ